MAFDWFTVVWVVLLIALLILLIISLTFKSITRDVGAPNVPAIDSTNFSALATKINVGIPQHILTPSSSNVHFWLPNGSYQGQTLIFLMGDPNNYEANIYVWVPSFRVNGDATIHTNEAWYPFADTLQGSIAKAIWYDGAWAISNLEYN
jgi:hypothetical protein